jgi:hypothetical protein
MPWQRKLPFIILTFVVVFHAVLLFPEAAERSPELNDSVFHYSLCVSMLEEMESGGNPIDHWVPYWSIGYPVFHHYHHLPHLAVVLTHLILLKQVPLFTVFKAWFYLLLVVYPMVLYYSLRRMRFPRISSAGAALFALTLSHLNGYGFELGSYVWRGSGMYTQLWAMVLLPLTLSSIYNTLREGRQYFRSVILLFLLTLSHMIFGLIGALTALLFIFHNFKPEEMGERIKRLLVIFAVFAFMISYFLVPMVLDSPYHAHSTYDSPEKWDSYGFRYAVTNFLNGNILDSGRLPVVTILAGFGLFFALSRKAPQYRWAAAGFMLWFLLYFGRPVWGGLIDLLPMSSALHLHRFITMVHFFGAILAGIGLSEICRKIKTRFRTILAVVFIALLAFPVYWDRFEYLKTNTAWLRESKAGFLEEKADFEKILISIKESPPGRVYPGRRANWGKDFKIGRASVFYLLGPRKIPALSYLPFSWALSGDFSVNFNEWRNSHCDLFNVRYILADRGWNPPSFSREMKRAGRFRLYRINTTGYFDVVDSPLAVYGDKNSIWNLIILWMRSPQVDQRRFISLFFDRDFHPGYQDYLVLRDRNLFWRIKPGSERERPVSVFSMADDFAEARPWKGRAGRVLREEAGKNRFSARVAAGRDCFLLFKMTYHPGWRAYVDGREAGTVMLSPGLTGVRIEKGEHEVEFVYRAPGWKTPLFLAGLFVAAGLFFRERKKR